MSRRLLTTLFAMFSVCIMYGQAVPDPEDLVLTTPDGERGYHNPDSLCRDASSFLCAKRYFWVQFLTPPFHDSAAADGNGLYDLEDFDDTHNDYFLWRRLDSMTNGLHLHLTTTDSASANFNRYMHVSFDSYIRVDTVLSYFAAMDSVESSDLSSKAIRTTATSTDPGYNPVKSMTQITGTSVTPNNEKRYTLLGYQYNLHLTKTPMAWEITKGSNQVYVGVDDVFDPAKFDQADFNQHRDLHKVSNGGNYLFPARKADGTLEDWDGTTLIRPAHHLHPYANLGIIAAEDNGVGLVGFAPGVRVFQTHNTGDNRYAQLDVSSTTGMQLPHVMSCAYLFESGTTGTYEEALENGIVVVSTGPNSEVRQSYDLSFNPYTVSGVNADYNEPELSPLGGKVILHPTDPQKDVKILAVEQYEHTLVRGGQQTCPLFNSFGYGPQWDYNQPTSMGLDKFSTSGTREQDKALAYIDVVVPKNYIGIYLDGTTSAYEEYCTQNSRAVPQAAAIIGLMNSVHPRLGKTGMDVHRRVYDIVTFTADKILDLQPSHTAAASITSEGSAAAEPYSKVFNDDFGTPHRVFAVPNKWYSDFLSPLLDGSGKLKTGYADQLNDALHRWWAPRFGFGRINAFRCVAHSIPGTNLLGQANVQYQYSSGDLDWAKGHPLSGTTYLHLGKFKDATTKVLDGGGVAYTGEPSYMNNNGKTLVDVNLSVGTSQTLVVDGILTTSLSSDFKKISTSSTGKILATGWVENVDLEGLVKASDLRIKRTALGTALKTTGASELSDTIWLRGNGDIVVSSGTLTLQIGATVYVNDLAKIIVKAGAELKLKHGARIIDIASTKLANRIVLEAKNGATPGGKLTIESLAEETVIDAIVQVNDDALFQVNAAETEAYPSVSIYKVVVESGGKVACVDDAFVKRINSTSMTPALVLKSSTGLVIPNNATVRLDVPVDIQSGSKIDVGTSATLKLGALTVQNNGALIARAGSTVQFLDEENTIYGKLVGEGTSTDLVKFKASNESTVDCPILKRQNFVRLNVVSDKWIYNTHSPGTQTLDLVLASYFHAQYAEFTNVYTSVKNVPILARVSGTLVPNTLKNCTFKADRSVYVAAGMESAYRAKKFFLFNVNRDIRQFAEVKNTGGEVPSQIYKLGQNHVRNLRIEDCSFYDAGGKISSTNYRALKQDNIESAGGDYPVSGVKISSLVKTTIANNKFAFLHAGVHLDNGSGTISSNVFGAHADAVVVKGAVVCNNVISGCVNGVRTNGGGAQVFDNIFGGTMTSSTNSLFGSAQVDFVGSGYWQTLGGIADCRNNELENYGTGLHANEGIIEARDRFAFLSPVQADRGKALVNGRNEFSGQTAGGTNPYLKAEERSDIFLGNTGIVQLECGKNVFSATQQYQLQKSANAVNINVKTNDFGVDLQASIRHNAPVTPLGTDLRNGEHPYGEDCAPGLRERETETECTTLPVYDPDAFTPYYNLGSMHASNVKLFAVAVPDWDDIDTVYAREIHHVASSWLSNSGLDVATRTTAIENAVQSARVHPKTDSVTTLLLATLQTMGLDTNVVLELREKAMLARVDLLSMNERYDEAKLWIDSARVGAFSGFDSVHINLLSSRLAVMADTSMPMSDFVDTLNALTSLEVEHAKRPDGFSKETRPSSKVVDGAVAFIAYPNPTSDYITVRYQGSRTEGVVIRVLNLMGVEVARVHQSTVAFGDEIVIPCQTFTHGNYVVEVNNGHAINSTSVTVIR